MANLHETEPWQWSEQEWRGEVERVRAGQSLADDDVATRWPDGKKCAVLVTFDSDHETPFLRDKQTSPGNLAVGEFGSRVGVPRILRMLERTSVPATFFVPAVSALLHPQDVEAFTSGNHDVAVHGWIHERNTMLGYEDELDLIGRATDVLERLTGSKPTGIRTPSWDFSPSTLRVIRELGFAYDASLMAAEEPYELLEAGEKTGVVEIPCEWIRDDAPYFMMDRFGGLRPHISPRDVEQIWTDEFDAAYNENGLFELTMHPHISGHRSRVGMVERLIEYIQRHEDVWIGTHAQLTEFLQAKYNLTPTLPKHSE